MNTRIRIPFLILATLALFLSNCTKDVTIPFPDVPSEVVVNGLIETGQPPLVFLTKTQSFNQPLDPTSLEDLFENDAIVRVSNGTDTITLDELCASELSGEALEGAAELLGVEVEDLSAINYCVYFGLNMTGEEGKEYELMIETASGQTMNSVTRIDPAVPLDSLWFELWAGSDSLGFLYAEVSDPEGFRNAYRWTAQRTNFYPGTTEQKDPNYIAPTGSTFEDRFFDGIPSVEFFYNRGQIANSNKDDDNNEESGFFKIGDSVDVKFSAITLETYDYIFISDDQATNNGSPFAVPTNLPSNIEGGLGLWSGYGPAFHNVVCIDTIP